MDGVIATANPAVMDGVAASQAKATDGAAANQAKATTDGVAANPANPAIVVGKVEE